MKCVWICNTNEYGQAGTVARLSNEDAAYLVGVDEARYTSKNEWKRQCMTNTERGRYIYNNNVTLGKVTKTEEIYTSAEGFVLADYNSEGITAGIEIFGDVDESVIENIKW